MSIQKKMFICTIAFLILPFLILGFLYYGILINTTKDNLDDSSYELLEQMERTVLSKTDRLQNKTDVLLSDRQFQQLLRDTDFLARDTTTFDAFAALDEIMEQYFYDEDDLESIILLASDGGIYTYRGSFWEESLTGFLVTYGRVEENPGELSWFGVSSGLRTGKQADSGLAAGLNLSDTNYIKDQKHLATAYFLFGSDFFEEVSSSSTQSDESFMICTAEGDRLYTHGEKKLPHLWEISMDTGRQVYQQRRGNLRLKVNGEDSILFFCTSSASGWKYIRLVSYKEYFGEAEYLRYLTVAIALFLFLLLCGINIVWLRQFTKPVRAIVTAMHEVGKRNFDVVLPVQSKDEFGVIARGFNAMVREIRELFRQVILEEQKSKEAELTALQYQINPHFLHNTLSAIRLTAIFNKQHEIANMLSLLGSFLHNTLSNVNKQILLEDEFNNLKAYIALYQIRYNNRILADFVIGEGLEQIKIRSMLIQPVVENAIMHGLSEKLGAEQPAVLRVEAESQDGVLVVRIWDNGVGMTEEQCRQALEEGDKKQTRLHIGLSNIHKRIKYLYGEDFGVCIDSVPGRYTEITLTLPLDSGESEGK